MSRDKASSFSPKIQNFVQWGILILIALMPFHAFLSVCFGSLVGHQSLIQAWKDILIVTLGLATAWLFVAYPSNRKILGQPINLVIIGFAVLSLVVSLVNHGFGSRHFWYGAKINLEFLALLLIAQVVSRKNVKDRLIKLLVVTTAVVAAFGVLQVVVLDKAFLTNFGYGAGTLLPYHLVDPAVPGSVRILSTLAGPNQLGSFLILPLCLLLFLIIKRRQYILTIPMAAVLFVLFHTYSRSAWIGAVIAMAITAILSLKAKITAIIGAVAITCALVALSQFNSLQAKFPKLEYYLLHSQSTGSPFQTSNQGHITGLERGISSIMQQPWGRGLGTAGPASNQTKDSLITENYYLQVAVEVGIAGLILFVVINWLLAIKLFSLRKTSLIAIPCLAALVGLGASNLFLHTWSDSSTALIFWGVAGVAITDLSHEVKKSG